MRIWPGALSGVPHGAPAAWTVSVETQLGLDLNDADNKIFATFAAHKAGVIADIGLIRYATAGSPPNYRLSVETLSATGDPSGSAFGGGAAFEAALNVANFGWYAIPSASRPTIANVGDRFCVVVGPGATAPTGVNFVSLSHGWSDSSERLWGFPYHAAFTTSWQRFSDFPAIALRLTDGTILWPSGVSTVTTTNFASPVAYGIEFRIPFASADLIGFRSGAGGTGDFSARLYRGTETSPLKTTGTRLKVATADPTNFQAWVDFFSSTQVLAPLTTYYLVVAAETATPVIFAHATVLGAGERDALLTDGLFDWFPVTTPNIGTLGTNPFTRINSGFAYTAAIQPILGAFTP